MRSGDDEDGGKEKKKKKKKMPKRALAVYAFFQKEKRCAFGCFDLLFCGCALCDSSLPCVLMRAEQFICDTSRPPSPFLSQA